MVGRGRGPPSGLSVSSVAAPAPLTAIVLLDERGDASDAPSIAPVTGAEAAIALVRGTPAAAHDFAGTLGRLGGDRRLRPDPAPARHRARSHLGSPARPPGVSPMTLADPRTTALLGLMDSYRTLGRTSWIDATGRSMQPSIPEGSRLLVAFGRPAQRRGEVIVFRRGERSSPTGSSGSAGRQTARSSSPAATTSSTSIRLSARARSWVSCCWSALPDGRIDDLQARPRRAAVVATVSWWSGRAAGMGARRLRRDLHGSRLRRIALERLVGLSRVPTRVVSEALPRSVRGKEGGRG